MKSTGTAVTTEPRTLADLEQVIERGIRTFIEVGEALLEVRDRQLHREAGYERFEDYCKERWGWSRVRAHQLMDGARIASVLTTVNVEPPQNERQARELVPLLREDEEQVVQVWRELREKHGDGVTADKVREAVGHQVRRDHVLENRKRRQAEAIECEWPPGSELIPREARWHSPKRRIRDRVQWLTQRRKRATFRGSLTKTLWAWNSFESLHYVSPEELAVPGVTEIISRLDSSINALDQELRRVLTCAMQELGDLEVPDYPPVPPYARTKEARDQQLRLNAREKNHRGYCAVLGCWKAVSYGGKCHSHPDGVNYPPAKDPPPIIWERGLGWARERLLPARNPDLA